MSSTLIDSVKSAITDVHLTRFSTLLGETEGNIRKAIHGAIPMVLTDILQKAYLPEGTAKIGNLARQAAADDFFGHLHELSVDSGGLVAGSVLLNKGADFERALLAPRTDFVVNEISRYSGISVPSASFITGIVSFASLDAIGRHMAHSNIDHNGLAPWLKTQETGIVAAIPAGLEVKPALGIHHYPWEKKVRTRQNTGLYILLAVIIIAAIAFFLLRNRPQADTTTVPATTDTMTTTTAPATANTDTVSSPAIRVSLPNGKVLDAYKDGMEDRLVRFLGDPNAKLDKENGNWFDFTKIGFASNSSSLLLESGGQLKNIVAILDAFPRAKFKIGGYSDNTGDSTDNIRLSRERARNIVAKLKELGAKSSQLTGAEGYGSNHPVGDNGTAGGRSMNRRMSIDVKAK